MVQMKELNNLSYPSLYDDFISHMVQMKEEMTLKGQSNFKTLYPTWFR